MNQALLPGPSDCYLSDLSPRDKPWDTHRLEATLVEQLFQNSDFDRYAQRMRDCSGLLGFGLHPDPETGEVAFKLKSARFCRVRQCPVCQWRRSLMWIARFLGALPRITADFPKVRWIFLTLTVRNCEPGELRATIQWMNASWKRLTHRREWPALGFARATEVTRGKDGSAHPHFHCLLMVRESYFKSKGYISQARWAALWQECLQIDYQPVVDVRAVRANKNRPQVNVDGLDGQNLDLAVVSAIVECFKYGVKPQDLIGDSTVTENREWLHKITDQLHKTRSIALGGVIRKYLSEKEPEDLIGESEDCETEELLQLHFGWREMLKRYTRVSI